MKAQLKPAVQRSQKELLLAYMHQINPQTGMRPGITALEAIGLFRIYRLAARINDLRDDGHLITTEIKTDATGKTFAKYYLDLT